MTVTEVGCVITAADPVVITDAARHKTAKLTVVAPGVATSPLAASRVRDVLATKGIVLASSVANATVTVLHPPGSAHGAADHPEGGTLPLPVSDAAAGWVVDQPDPKAKLPAPKPIGYDKALVETITMAAAKGTHR